MATSSLLAKDPGVDEKVISHFRSSVPQPYTQIAYFILTENPAISDVHIALLRETEKQERSKVMSQETAPQGVDLFCKQIAMDKTRFLRKKRTLFSMVESHFSKHKSEFQPHSGKVDEYKSAGKLPQSIRLSIVTNGSLLNEKNIELLRRNNRQIEFLRRGRM